ncbi:protein spaetzle 5 [Orussus abietinus]|uniref:protein spaetzle 5 n=1 Tax=Orussus abietinus TaxID=222816 RepID=UPI00062619AE|nr:protein spaetzle 5 [Orussus abietinus]XP_012272422.1 protein spaetzle 5 [Orussus abietinus]XP_012272423.1 protein spaetzle 5 [Orussus abietinus]
MTRRWGVLLLVFVAGVQSEPCTTYGCFTGYQEPFVPAPPGHTPRCAKPGQTFCESLEHYPQQLIRFLLDRCSFDFRTILLGESREDFNSYRSKPDYSGGYHYRKADDPQVISSSIPFLPPQYPLGHPAVIYGPPNNGSRDQGSTYPTTALRSQRNPFFTEPSSTQSNSQLQQLRQSSKPDPVFYQRSQQSLDPLKQEQGWFSNRYVRGTRRTNPLLEFASLGKQREKRQAFNQPIPLCPVNPQYITPKAALNNKGNWMYVVNLQEQDERYTQTVRSETCSTTTCNGLCSLPAGYTSNCQQQYVQKRLVALDGSGNRLYNDIFWFPHGCSCQVTMNY